MDAAGAMQPQPISTCNYTFPYYKIDGCSSMVGVSESMERLFRKVDVLARKKCSVLIRGETGTGKGMVAEALHYNGPRRGKKFVYLNCGAIPGELLESELFGHAKGAYTGASKNYSGSFLDADGGTLFLDETGNMSPKLQAKILDAVERKRVKPVGSCGEIEVDARIVAATNTDIERDVKEGRFRADLYHRLDVAPLVVPPLRQRRGDIAHLANYFMESLRRNSDFAVAGFTYEAMRHLHEYQWPGNVRELRNVIERAMVFKDREGPIDVEDLSLGCSGAESPIVLP